MCIFLLKKWFFNHADLLKFCIKVLSEVGLGDEMLTLYFLNQGQAFPLNGESFPSSQGRNLRPGGGICKLAGGWDLKRVK